IQRPVVVPRSLLPSVTTRRTLMGLIGSDTRLLVVTWSKLPAERPVSRMSGPVGLLSLVRAPAHPPQHAYFGSRSHTPSSRCLRFERRVAATPLPEGTGPGVDVGELAVAIGMAGAL